MNYSREHNWIVVGEVIRSIKTPVELYTDHIVKRWHKQLVSYCSTYGPCTTAKDCLLKKKPKDLCASCKEWHRNLESSHLNTNKSQIRWRQNCDTSRWSSDPWEIAKFFMSSLGDNKSTVKDAKSTDLSSLLNVLEWMGDVSFCKDKRIDLSLVESLRSKVRNAWAHAPKQEMTSDQLKNAFGHAENFLNDLEKIFTNEAVKKCKEDIQWLRENGVTNIAEAELNGLLLLRNELGHDVTKIKEDIKSLKEDQNSDRKRIEEQEEILKQVEGYIRHCCEKMEEFQQWKEHIDKLFCDVKKKFENFQEETKKNFMEIRGDIKELQDQAKSTQGKKSSTIESCIPEKLQTFTGRDKEVNEILSLLGMKVSEASHGIVSIIGGPGFGKSAIAIEVSHHINDENDIPVIFSYLSNITTVNEVVRRLCLDISILSSDEPMSSLTVWLKSINEKAVLVMDNIEQLQQGQEGNEFNNLLRLLRKNSKNRLQIIVTSTTCLEISDLDTKQYCVQVMGLESSINLLKKCCPEKQVQQDHLEEMAKLCGHAPLALRLLASRLDTDGPEELITWLKDMPMAVLEAPHAKIKSAIKTSFEILKDNEKKIFVRLAIFPGNFKREPASHVTGLDDLRTSNILRFLVQRSLLQQNGDKYTMHRLIRCFLNEESKGFEEEQTEAKRLMLEYYLKKCDDLTKLYWQKDGFNDARNTLKEELHNIEEVLKFCDEASKKINSNIVQTLVNSEIYRSLSRFFYNFVLEVLSTTVVRTFLQNCVNIANVREDFAVVVNFQCLVADMEYRISGWRSEKYKQSMTFARRTFKRNNERLGNNDVESHFYYCYGRYLFNAKKYSEAMKYGEKCYQLRIKENPTSLDKVDQIIVLHLLGKVAISWKKTENLEDAKERFDKAISISEKCLGSHELTINSYKKRGDMIYQLEKEEALGYYRKAVQIHETLGLPNNNHTAFNLLKNLGGTLWHLERKDEASPYLKEAFALLDKLPDTDQKRIYDKHSTRELRNEYEEWELNAPTCSLM